MNKNVTYTNTNKTIDSYGKLIREIGNMGILKLIKVMIYQVWLAVLVLVIIYILMLFKLRLSML